MGGECSLNVSLLGESHWAGSSCTFGRRAGHLPLMARVEVLAFCGSLPASRSREHRGSSPRCRPSPPATTSATPRSPPGAWNRAQLRRIVRRLVPDLQRSAWILEVVQVPPGPFEIKVVSKTALLCNDNNEAMRYAFAGIVQTICAVRMMHAVSPNKKNAKASMPQKRLPLQRPRRRGSASTTSR